MKTLAFTDFRTWSRDRFVDAQTRRSARLAPTYLIAHESGVEGGLDETLSAAEWSRIDFHLYSGSVKGAELLFYVNAYDGTRDTPMQMLVNGHALTHRQDRDKMLTGGWDRKRIHARYLQEGDNEFVFSHHGILHPPAAPSRCPMLDLVELTAIFFDCSANILLIATVSAISPRGVDVP